MEKLNKDLGEHSDRVIGIDFVGEEIEIPMLFDKL